MVDDIKLPKVLSSLSATHRIKKVKRRHTNLNQHRFGKQLQEEEEREKERTGQTEHLSENEDEERQDDRFNNAKGAMSPAEEEEDEKNKKQGKLVDVVV